MVGIWFFSSGTLVVQANNLHLVSRRCTEFLILLHPSRDARNHHISSPDILSIPPTAAASTRQGFQKQQQAIGNGSQWVSFLLPYQLAVCCTQKNEEMRIRFVAIDSTNIDMFGSSGRHSLITRPSPPAEFRRLPSRQRYQST